MSGGFVKFSLEQYEDAIIDFDQALRFKPDYTVAYHDRGYTKYELGQYEAAIADFECCSPN